MPRVCTSVLFIYFVGTNTGMEEESEYSESSSSAGFASRCEPSSSSLHLIPSRGPPKHTYGKNRSTKFKEEWKETYLMWPNESEDFMTCVVCSEKLTSFKVSTITRHIERKHKTSMHYAPAKKQWLVSSFQKSLAKQQLVLRKAITPNEMRKMALYKLALTLAKHKMPFSACEAFITFAKAADPDSIVFKNMAGSRNTIATKTGKYS